MELWRDRRPQDRVLYRDLGARPPRPVTGEWIHAAFTPPAERESWMQAVLAESDALVAELVSADIVVFGAPMYNFGLPAQLKAYVDNIVRVGVTFGFDRSRPDAPYWPLLSAHGKTAIVLTSRGDYGYGEGERLASSELVIPGLSVPLSYIGVTDVRSLAVEYDEFGDDRLETSLREADEALASLADEMVRERGAPDANVA